MKNKTIKWQCYQGIALIEAMIASLVISTGMLAITVLFSQLIHGNEQVQLREEALDIAHNQLQTFQQKADLNSFQNIQSGNKTVVSANQHSFSLNWQVNNINSHKKQIKIEVSWPRMQNTPVTLQHELRWQDPVLFAASNTHGIENGYAYLSPVDLQNQQFSPPLSNQLVHIKTLAHNFQLKRDNKGFIYVIDGQGKIVRRINQEPSSNGDYFQISGSISFQSNLSMDYQVIASGDAFCSLGNTQTIVNSPLVFQDYQCYVASNWRGKIGLLFNPTSNLSEFSICPQISREYIAYDIVNGQLITRGISQNYAIQNFVVSNSQVNCTQAYQQILAFNPDWQNQLTQIKQILRIDDRKVIHFNVDVVDNFQQAMFLSTNEIQSNCRLIRQENNHFSYHCAIAQDPLTNAFWQGQLKIEIKNANTTCQHSLSIDTTKQQDYQITLPRC